MATVELEHVTVYADGRTLLDDVGLSVDDGELIGIVGASGAGKTTLLRAIGGLVGANSGTVRIGGVDVTNTPAGERDVAMVFQTPVLIPTRDVRGNVAFPLELRHQGRDEIDTR